MDISSGRCNKCERGGDHALTRPQSPSSWAVTSVSDAVFQHLQLNRILERNEMYVPASSASTSLILRPSRRTRKRIQPLWMLRLSLVHMMSGGGSPSTGQGSLMALPSRALCLWATLSATCGGPGSVWEIKVLEEEEEEEEEEEVVLVEEGRPGHSEADSSRLSPLLIGSGPPQVADKVAHRQSARLGSAIKLPCPVDGDPPPLIMWTKDSRNIHSGWIRFRVLRLGLKIKEVEAEDAGTYICKATNGFGSVNINYTLIVIGKEYSNKICWKTASLTEVTAQDEGLCGRCKLRFVPLTACASAREPAHKELASSR
ncbi:hypothetical protein CRUP_005853 [Coryphaenoides rupestris]|nr:hypothetical protein CRUP_005853 [Coryphaenoides rupestris]